MGGRSVTVFAGSKNVNEEKANFFSIGECFNTSTEYALVSTPSSDRRARTRRRDVNRPGWVWQGVDARLRTMASRAPLIVLRPGQRARPSLAPAHSLRVVDVVQLVLDLHLDTVLDLELDLRRVVGVQGRRVEIAGEDRPLRGRRTEEVHHQDLVDAARAAAVLQVEITHTERIRKEPAHGDGRGRRSRAGGILAGGNHDQVRMKCSATLNVDLELVDRSALECVS